MEHPLVLFFALCVGHALVDYGLSTEYIALNKSHRREQARGEWPWVLLAHSLMHGGAVFFITGHAILGVGELLAHALTDYLKSDGRISYGADQTIHYLTKSVWVILALTLMA